MLVNGRHWSIRDGVEPLTSGVPLLIGIDPSKSGYALTIGDEWGKDKVLLELSGKGMETDDFILELKTFLISYLKVAPVAFVEWEAMILKKGLGYYHSSEVLHDVRVATKQIFDILEIPYNTVNNMEWKGAILPDGYRSKKEKGSVRFCRELDYTKFAGKSDNITDSYCIYLNLVRKRGTPTLTCDASEKAVNEISIMIVPTGCPEETACSSVFNYNGKFSLKENANYYSNRAHKVGKSRVLLEDLTIEDIYLYSYGFSGANVDNVSVIVIPDLVQFGRETSKYQGR